MDSCFRRNDGVSRDDGVSKGDGTYRKGGPVGAAFLLGVALTLTLSQGERESREQQGYLSLVVLTCSTARTILS